jgi:hypothetical protein
MRTHVVYNDLVPVSQEVRGIVNVPRYGQVLYRKQTLTEHFRAACAATPGVDFTALLAAEDATAFHDLLVARGEHDPTRYVFVGANLGFLSARQFQIFLQKVSTVGRALFCQGRADGRLLPIVVCGRPQLLDFLTASTDPTFATIDPTATRIDRYEVLGNESYLVDLSGYLDFVGFLQSSYEVRFFNRIVEEDRFVVKISTDVEKIEREFRYHAFLPPRMRCFFLGAFDFERSGDRASYKMERLRLPDLATLWLHGALSPKDFDQLLDAVFTFLDLRERKPVAREIARARMQELYVDKVRERIERLRSLPVCADLDSLLRRHTSYGSLEALLERYLGLYEREVQRDVPAELAFSHGDLCFSNILYDKRLDLLKLIDPRGADDADDAYLDPLYDVAKLSHSVFGLYDALNNGQFRLELGGELRLALTVESPPLPDGAREAFAARLAQRGISLRTVRILEASLFLSMLPLHADNPRKLLALLLNGAAILDAVAEGRLDGAVPPAAEAGIVAMVASGR